MAVVFYRALAIPLWVVVFGVVAFTAPPRVMPSIAALIAIAVIASTIMAMVRWRSSCRPLVEVLPAAGRDSRAQAADDAVDLVRMDDDGGWQLPREPRLR